MNPLTPTQMLVGGVAAVGLGGYFFLRGVRHEPEGRRFGHHPGYARKKAAYFEARANRERNTQTRRSR